MGILLLVRFKGVGLLLVLGEGHLAGLAVAGDLEEGAAGFQEDVAWQDVGIFAFQAGAELAADAVARVHQWGRGRYRGARFKSGYNIDYAMVTVELFGKVVGNVISRL